MLSLNLNKPNLKYLKFKDFDSIQLFFNETRYENRRLLCDDYKQINCES